MLLVIVTLATGVLLVIVTLGIITGAGAGVGGSCVVVSELVAARVDEKEGLRAP